MSEEILNSTSAATGTFRTLATRSNEAPAGGNSLSSSGRPLPANEESGPDLEALADKLNLRRHSIGRLLRFQVDISNGSSVIQVLDRETGELIREIPPEKARIATSSDGGLEIRLLDSLI
ncbi:MAG TPA: flagellar protein FlaG [Woeseiaceae bacterium]|nr:flagellar protein FlaG [Woeseiaceae bacterium]